MIKLKNVNIIIMWIMIFTTFLSISIAIWQINSKYNKINNTLRAKTIVLPQKNKTNERFIISGEIFELNNKQKFINQKTNKKQILLLSGILVINNKKACIINGMFLKEGDTIKNIKIIKIFHNKVEIEINGQNINIKPGEKIIV
ncbi:hypothetical protein Thein_1882 [Thermodesulfatator indicus DSM 15286]|uniref:Uncharacterized protein n=1 Tax=Thermodesulfatator indicus (strain DSM 15286 / JCM 11887 / CIR29812) TaxID=667014 RepID=F8ACA2_THEID|nr:hypothetical protein [Thermodesulfatator indicus]AEH45737.1 hypothetical protein Thein_1882 [Thermodesulfatator indicus DSM 15286]